LAARVTAAAVCVLMLASCGSSSSLTSTATNTETVSSKGAASESQASATAAQPAPSPVATPGCRHVPAPPSRVGEPASKATKRLDPAHSYTVRLATNCGTIVIRLAVAQAPKTTASFAHLVQTGYYNELTFHRVVPDFVIQGGDPKGDGTGGPSWEIVEPPPANLRYTKGVVAMAKGSTAPAGTSGSQFFIVTGSSVNLPHTYALIGHVVFGEKAVEAIAHVPTEAASEGAPASKPLVPIVIEKATLIVH
jgi:peptidyl-prolyl cis-trans isomerase B (cyclophilin B)